MGKGQVWDKAAGGKCVGFILGSFSVLHKLLSDSSGVADLRKAILWHCLGGLHTASQ